MPQTAGKPHGRSNGAMFPKAWSAHSSGRDARRRSVWIILSVRRISLGGAEWMRQTLPEGRIEGSQSGTPRGDRVRSSKGGLQLLSRFLATVSLGVAHLPPWFF